MGTFAEAAIVENGTKRKTATSVCFLQTENENGKPQFVYCKKKRKKDSLLSLGSNRYIRKTEPTENSNLGFNVYTYMIYIHIYIYIYIYI
jgi:hypothetical protein